MIRTPQSIWKDINQKETELVVLRKELKQAQQECSHIFIDQTASSAGNTCHWRLCRECGIQVDFEYPIDQRERDV